MLLCVALSEVSHKNEGVFYLFLPNHCLDTLCRSKALSCPGLQQPDCSLAFLLFLILLGILVSAPSGSSLLQVHLAFLMFTSLLKLASSPRGWGGFAARTVSSAL